MCLLIAAGLIVGCATPAPARPTTPTAPTAPPAPQTAPGDGAILSRAPCELPSYDALLAKLTRRVSFELDKSGLAAELAARPIDQLYPREDLERVRTAASEGRCERIVYRSGGLRIAGFIMRPTAAGKRPAVLYARGGNAEFGKVGARALMRLQHLVDRGYVVLASQYRGAGGSEGADEFGGKDVDDLLALIPLARSLPEVDGDNLFLYGRSRGVMQATLALRRGADVRAAILVSGLYDLADAVARRPEMRSVYEERIPGFSANPDPIMRDRSVVNWPGELRVPILMIHARQDWRASIEPALALDAALGKLGHPRELIIYERDDHSVTFHYREMFEKIARWIEQHRTRGDQTNLRP